MEQQGKWVTIHGAHVFIRDGEEPKFNKPTIKKTLKKDTSKTLEDLLKYAEDNNLDFGRVINYEIKNGNLKDEDEIEIGDTVFKRNGKAWERYDGKKRIWTGTTESVSGEIADRYKGELQHSYWKSRSDRAQYESLQKKADSLNKVIAWTKNPQSKAEKQKQLDKIHKEMEKYK